jgi:hypothetical protein
MTNAAASQLPGGRAERGRDRLDDRRREDRAMTATATEILQEARRIYEADGIVVPVDADVPEGCVCALIAVDRAVSRMCPVASEWAGEADEAYRLVEDRIGGGSAWGVMVAGAESRERVLAGYADAIAAAAQGESGRSSSR